jgi:CheY-like chemotaxis protein
VETDPLRLRQILYNLVGNAFKFTSAGTVSLDVMTVDSKLRFVISDTGRGIAESDLPHLFKPFYQATDHEQYTEGIGLGLYITDKLVSLLGGQISATSVLGEGSKFSIELPLKLATGAMTESVKSKVVGYEGAVQELLVVDDDASNRDVLKQFLTEVGFSVREADSGDAALRVMRSHRFEGVISDIRMTGKDGNAFCREVRSDSTLAGAVMIASSASVYEGDRRAAESAGFDDFLPKPVTEQDLFAILGKHLGIKWIVRHDSGEIGSSADRNIPVDVEDVLTAGRDLPVEELRQLLTLAGEGDVVALRRSLQELAETDPAYARFAEHLAVLVSAYRIDEVETLLQQLTCDSSDVASAKSEAPVAK